MDGRAERPDVIYFGPDGNPQYSSGKIIEPIQSAQSMHTGQVCGAGGQAVVAGHASFYTFDKRLERRDPAAVPQQIKTHLQF